MAHRGPDGTRVVQPMPGCTLGHNRLSIVDLSDANNQPMSLNDRYWMVFNGEIFNYKELRTALSSVHQFKTTGDSEVLLAAYAHWGPECQHRFNGMWAFAIYDCETKSLFASRDRYGQKPFYYTLKNGRFAFASETQALQKSICPDSGYYSPVMQRLMDGHFDAQSGCRTYLEQVFSLEPGHELVLREGGNLTTQRWYTFQTVSLPGRYEERVEVFKNLLDDAIRLRLQADVPIGTCLSGGLDSSSIAASIHHMQLRGELEAPNFKHISFTAGFPGSFLDETAAARRLSEKTGMEHVVKNIFPPQPDQLLKAVRAMDGPQHSLAFFPIWSLFEEVKQHGITVTLDGQGPDELLGGYLTHQLMDSAFDSAIGTLDVGRLIDLHQTWKILSATSPNITLSNTNLFKRLRFDLGALRRRTTTLSTLKQTFKNYLFEQFSETPMLTILMQTDRCSMAHAVECRMPFLDHRLVEFSLSLPDSDRLGKRQSKRILRDAMRGRLPEVVRMRMDKIGFNAPLHEWLKGPLKDFFLDTVLSEAFQSHSAFDGREVSRAVLKKLETGTLDWFGSWSLWPKLNLVLLDNP
jgi:asparagine synthase (glutamine-hydrolysing)